MGFTKLDERIVESSIMAESPVTFKVWITLLAKCRENGMAYVSAVYLSSVCHLPLSKVESALAVLEAPDTHSRSLADEGRRVRRVDGGYLIINYDVYRDASLRDAEAERKRLYRRRINECPDMAGRSPDPSASVSASASEDKKKGVDSDFASWWSLYPRKVEKKVAMKAYIKARKDGASAEELAQAIDGYRQQIDRDRTEERYIKHASTFLHEDRWRDYLPQAAETPDEYRARHDAEMKRLQAEGK